ncbi:transmembrane protein 116 [Conger conger]|uniref:transmembrane protein 116 n=1 Tax=Conger conger TaxID=82655 RepID=UPI002A59B43E|nr:transmembrane protein 116 [Conger conger]
MSLEESAPFQTGLNGNQIKNLSIVYVSSLSLSLLGSFSVVVVSISKRRHLNEQAWPLLQLALADFLASAVLLGTNAINFVPYSRFTQRISFCQRGLPLAVAFYGISFLLVMVYACRSKRAIQGWRERTEGGRDGQSEGRRSQTLCVVYAVVWSAPIAVYILYVLTEGLMEARLLTHSDDTTTHLAMSNDSVVFCTSCILLLHIRNDSCPHVDKGHDLFVKSFFFVSGLSVLICCTVMYCKVGSWYRGYKERGMFLVEGDGFARRNLKGLYSTARNMVLVIFFCWAPAFVLVSLSFIDKIPEENLYPLYIIQALTLSLQGLLDSMVYGWLRRNFREAALGERMPLLASPSKAFYDESLTTR